MKALDWTLLAFGALILLGAGQQRVLTLAEMRALAVEAGFPDPDLAAAVAMAESGGRASIIVPEPHGGPSYGLWQIHQSDHPKYSPVALLDPRYNARAAFEISKQGSDWTPWATFNAGLHLRWMPKA
jgi:lysozyme-like protein